MAVVQNTISDTNKAGPTILHEVPERISWYCIPPRIASEIQTRPARVKSHFRCIDMGLAVSKVLLGLSILDRLNRVVYCFDLGSQLFIRVQGGRS